MAAIYFLEYTISREKINCSFTVHVERLECSMHNSGCFVIITTQSDMISIIFLFFTYSFICKLSKTNVSYKTYQPLRHFCQKFCLKSIESFPL